MFAEFIATNYLLNVNFIGSQFTWCNNQQGLARRWARLDRCLVNLAWANNFDSCLVKHLHRFLSDHSPMLLSLIPRDYCKKKISDLKIFGLITWAVMMQLGNLGVLIHTLILCKLLLTFCPALGISS